MNPCPLAFNETPTSLVSNPKYEEWQATNKLLLGWLYSSITKQVMNYGLGLKNLLDSQPEPILFGIKLSSREP